jgi:ketosteroid isomerase-like protein
VSTSNVDLVRQGYDAYGKRDMVGAFALFDPKIEIAQTPELPWGGRHKGLIGAARFFSILGKEVDATPAIDYLIPAGDDVVDVGRLHGKARKTGHPIDIPIVHVWTIRAGKIVKFAAYIDTPEMRKALGLVS